MERSHFDVVGDLCNVKWERRRRYRPDPSSPCGGGAEREEEWVRLHGAMWAIRVVGDSELVREVGKGKR